MNRRTFTAALLLLPVAPAYASSSGGGGRLNAISEGRIYDRRLTPRLNPGFRLQGPAEQKLLRDIELGRVDTSQIPPGRLRHLQNKLRRQR